MLWNLIAQIHRRLHYKKTRLLRRAKTAAKAQKIDTKGPFGLLQRGLLWQFYPLALWCRNSSIAAVTKNATINAPFSGVFGFLWRAKNYRHISLEFVLIDF